MASLVKIINVRVDRATASAIEQHVAEAGGSVSDFARTCLELAVGRPLLTVDDRARKLSDGDAFGELNRVNADLARLGNLFSLAAKSGCPASADLERALVSAIDAVRDAARRRFER